MSIAKRTERYLNYDAWKTATPWDNMPPHADDVSDLVNVARALDKFNIQLGDVAGAFEGQWPFELTALLEVEFEIDSDRPRLDACKFLLGLAAKIVTECGVEDAQELIEAVNALHAAALRKGVA